MKISCQSCQSKYNVADEKVQGKIVKIRCRKCGATIVVDGNAPATANGSAAGAEASAGYGATGGADGGGDGQWHVNVSESDQRTLSLGELVDAYNGGVVNQDTFIWTDGMDDWRPLGEVDAVVAALHAAAGAAGSADAAGDAQGYGQEAHEAPPTEQREDAPTQAFSYDAGGAGAYGSPFGHAAQAAQAAPEPEPEPAPRRAAVVKSRGRDLFGEGGGGDEVQTSAPSIAQAQAMSRGAAEEASNSMTGERNENSVLFSLAALTKNSGPSDLAPPPVAGSKDDSGLIDLKALAMKTQSSRPAAPKAESDLFSAPLGFTPSPLGSPIGALGSPIGAEGEPKSKLPLMIGGGVGVLLLLVLGVVIGVKIAAGPAPAPSASIAAAPPPSASAEPAPSATAEPSAAAPAPSASVAAAPKPKPAGGGGVHVGGGGATAPKPPGGGGTAPATTAAAAPAQTAAPKKNDCGCNGDLMCLMKCSTH